jgi:hypothetical protein
MSGQSLWTNNKYLSPEEVIPYDVLAGSQNNSFVFSLSYIDFKSAARLQLINNNL